MALKRSECQSRVAQCQDASPSWLYPDMVTRASVCPVCEKPVGPEHTVYTISERDYHAECYEKSKPEPSTAEDDASRG